MAGSAKAFPTGRGSGAQHQGARPENVKSANRWVGIIGGMLLLLTIVIPWGMYGGKPLWSWTLFKPVYGSLRFMLICCWVTGVIVLVAGLSRPGTGVAVIYLLVGAAGLGAYLIGTQASPLPWQVFVPISTHHGLMFVAAVGVPAVFLVVTGVRQRKGVSAGGAIRAIEASAAVALALLVVITAYDNIHGSTGAAHRENPSVRAVFVAGLLVAWTALMACWLAVHNALSSPGDTARGEPATGRRLALLGLAALFVSGVFTPVMHAGSLLASLGPLNNQLFLAILCALVIEGLVGVLSGVKTAPADASFSSRQIAAVGTRRRQNIIGAVVAGLIVATVVVFAGGIRGSQNQVQSAPVVSLRTGDWPQWCGGTDRNMVSGERNLPVEFDDVSTAKTTALANVKWIARLSNRTLGSPVVAGGKVYIGGMGKNRSGLLWCFAESDGQFLWRMESPLVTNVYETSYGTCATPTVENDRVYLLGHMGDVLCMSADGMAHGNHGPFTDESQYFATGRNCTKVEIAPDGSRILEWTPGERAEITPDDPDILWRYDLLTGVNCWPFNALNAAVVVRGDRLYIATCSTLSRSVTSAKIDEWKQRYHKAAYPSPALIVLDKHTGRLLARESEGIFDTTFHGAHSSPTFGTVNGKELLFYGGGNGTCYAFDPDFTPEPGGRCDTLKLVWKFNCVDPASYGSGFGLERPKQAEIIGTPAFHNGRVYVPIGNDLMNSGSAARAGRLVCIDARGSGDITRTGRIWSFDEMRSTASTVAIADGLLYTADAGGSIYCLDADTGKPLWTHSTTPVWASPLIADGKVYVPTHNGGLLIFAHSREKKLLSHALGNKDLVASPVVANGVLYIASQRNLYALKQGSHGSLMPNPHED